MKNYDAVREFLVTRRAEIQPQKVGLAALGDDRHDRTVFVSSRPMSCGILSYLVRYQVLHD